MVLVVLPYVLQRTSGASPYVDPRNDSIATEPAPIVPLCALSLLCAGLPLGDRRRFASTTPTTTNAAISATPPTAAPTISAMSTDRPFALGLVRGAGSAPPPVVSTTAMSVVAVIGGAGGSLGGVDGEIRLFVSTGAAALDDPAGQEKLAGCEIDS